MMPERRELSHSILEVDFDTRGAEHATEVLRTASRHLLDASARLRRDSDALRRQIIEYQRV